MKPRMRYVIAGLVALMLAACSPTTPRNTGVYLLLDTSGTYNEELQKAQSIILFTLSRLQATDSFAVARIDTGSFSEKDIIAKATFDDRPSAANNQKRAFAAQIKNFVELAKPASHTDITGGILQAIEFLNEKNSGRKTILIFSDLQEDLAKGYVRDVPLNLKGFEVVALNVTKLRSDNIDPREYKQRLVDWQSRVEAGGALVAPRDALERHHRRGGDGEPPHDPRGPPAAARLERPSARRDPRRGRVRHSVRRSVLGRASLISGLGVLLNLLAGFLDSQITGRYSDNRSGLSTSNI